MTSLNVFGRTDASYERVQARPAGRDRRDGGTGQARRRSEPGTIDMLVDAITSMLR